MKTLDNMSGRGLLRLTKAVPALIGLLCAFSFTARADRSVESVENRTASVETVETTFVEQPVSEDHPYCVRTETMPTFQGGDLKTFYHWVQMQVRVPAEAMEKRLQGRVTVSFIVERDGTLGDIRILQTPDKVFSEEVMRVLERSDKWTPGIDGNGDTVRVKFVLPVDFRLIGAEASAEQEAAPKPDVAEKASEDESRSKPVTYPTFRGGGLDTFRRWLREQMKVPDEVWRKGKLGRVVATFVIEKDGTLDQIRIVSSPHWLLSREIFRVLERSDKWTPGIDEQGDTVRVGYTLPVDFKALSD